MDGCGAGLDAAFEGGGKEIRFQFDRGETCRACGQVGHRAIAAERVGERDEAAGMEEAIGRMVRGGNLEMALDEVALQRGDNDAEMAGKFSLTTRGEGGGG